MIAYITYLKAGVRTSIPVGQGAPLPGPVVPKPSVAGFRISGFEG